MLTDPNWIELLDLFKNYEVRFLVVGGHAVMNYTEPRYTKDLDVWIAIDPKNATRTYQALKEFGAPLGDFTPEDFSRPGVFFQIGHAPVRIDIMMSIQGVDFEDCWKRRQLVHVGNTTLPFISKSDLILAKRASGRPQDLLDVEKLEKSEN